MNIEKYYTPFVPSKKVEKEEQYNNPNQIKNQQLLNEANIKTNLDYRKYLVKNSIGIIKYNQQKLI